MQSTDSTYAIAIVVLALVWLGIAGVRSMRASRGRGLGQYFLGGHTVTWMGLAASLFVTSLWALWCVGVELSFQSNALAWSILGLGVAAGLLLLATVFSPVFRQRGVLTVAEYLSGSYRHAGTSATVASAFILLTLLIRIPITIVLGGKLLHAIFGWDPVTAALLMIVVPGIFAVAGGYAAAFAIQGVAAVVAVAGLVFLGSAGTPETILPFVVHFTGPVPHWTFLAGGLAVFAFWQSCVDQSIVQRVAAAASSRDPRRAAFAAAGAIALGGLAIGIGAATRTTNMLPSGDWAGLARGFVGASLLACAMAALAGHFLSVSTMCTMDIFRQLRSASDESVLVLIGRLMTTMAVVFSILVSSVLALVGDAAIIWLVVAYVVFGVPLAAVALVGFGWARQHAVSAFAGLLVGWSLGCVQAVVRADHMMSHEGLLWVIVTAFGGAAATMAGLNVCATSGISWMHVMPRRDIRVPKS